MSHVRQLFPHLFFLCTRSLKFTFSIHHALLTLVLACLSSTYAVGGLEVSVSPSSEPLEEDDVVLQCKADKLIYDNLAWFRVSNISESEQIAPVQPCRSLMLHRKPLSHGARSSPQGTNVTLELSLPNVSRQDEGLYACQVENIKTQKRTCLLRWLSFKSECQMCCMFKISQGFCRGFRADVQDNIVPSYLYRLVLLIISGQKEKENLET